MCDRYHNEEDDPTLTSPLPLPLPLPLTLTLTPLPYTPLPKSQSEHVSGAETVYHPYTSYSSPGSLHQSTFKPSRASSGVFRNMTAGATPIPLGHQTTVTEPTGARTTEAYSSSIHTSPASPTPTTTMVSSSHHLHAPVNIIICLSFLLMLLARG